MEDRVGSLRLDPGVVAELIATSREVAQRAVVEIGRARRLCEQNRALRAARAQHALAAAAAGGTLNR